MKKSTYQRLFLLALVFSCIVTAFAQDSQWALVTNSVAHIRANKGNTSELSSQELMGMPVKLMEKDGDWWHVQTADGYSGWLRNESIVKLSNAEMNNWKRSNRLVVTSLGQIKAYATPHANGVRDIVTDLLPCNIVQGSLNSVINGRVEILLPDGRSAWAEAAAFTPIEKWAAQQFNPMVVLNQAYSLVGTPYLWGGASAKALDCSGLSKLAYLANGIFLRRDASLQACTGKQLDPKDWTRFKAGDLIFFGNKKTGKITHVGIYDGSGKFVHSTGYGDRVRVNSLDPASPDYYKNEVLKAVRISGCEDTNGIVTARQHPWLF